VPDELDDMILALIESEDRLTLPERLPRAASDQLPDESSESRRLRGPLDLATEAGLIQAIRLRVWSISFTVNNTVLRQRTVIDRGVSQLEAWIRGHTVVRVIGAGRALHAAAMPANRLAHAGADVHVINDVVPLPNSAKGGGIIAASASGQTQAVLDIMRQARELNPEIVIMGIADRNAAEFASHCDIFIGIEDVEHTPYQNSLRALADTGEYVISEVLDAMVVAAGKRCGLTDEDFRRGHEDLGPTGPYRPNSAS
jgi:D-arabinose 5-phosphate isomerase GutQ